MSSFRIQRAERSASPVDIRRNLSGRGRRVWGCMNESRVLVDQCASFTELALSLPAGCTALVPLDADLTDAYS